MNLTSRHLKAVGLFTLALSTLMLYQNCDGFSPSHKASALNSLASTGTNTEEIAREGISSDSGLESKKQDLWLGTNLSPVSLGRYLTPDPSRPCPGQVIEAGQTTAQRFDFKCLHEDGQFLITDLHRGQNKTIAAQSLQAMAGASRNTLSLVLHYMNWNFETMPFNSWDGSVRLIPQGLSETSDHRQYLANIIDVAKMAKLAGMKRLILRFGALNDTNPANWHPAGQTDECTWDEPLYAASRDFTTNIIKQIEAERAQYAPLEIYYDAALELGGSRVGCSQKYVRNLLAHLTSKKYGSLDTSNPFRDVKLLGSSMAYNKGYIANYFDDLSAIDYREPFIAAVDFYDVYEKGEIQKVVIDGATVPLDVFKMFDFIADDFTALLIKKPSAKLLVLETYYNDAKVAAYVANRSRAFKPAMLGYLEWPNDRTTFLNWMNTQPPHGNAYSTEFGTDFVGLNTFARTMEFSDILAAGAGCADLNCIFVQSKIASDDVCIKLLNLDFVAVGANYCGAQVVKQTDASGTVYTARLSAEDAAYKRTSGIRVLLYSESKPHLYSNPFPDVIR